LAGRCPSVVKSSNGLLGGRAESSRAVICDAFVISWRGDIWEALTHTSTLVSEWPGVEGKETVGLGGRERLIATFCLKDCAVGIDDKELSAR
jgi:hypothetical protein